MSDRHCLFVGLCEFLCVYFSVYVLCLSKVSVCVCVVGQGVCVCVCVTVCLCVSVGATYLSCHEEYKLHVGNKCMVRCFLLR